MVAGLHSNTAKFTGYKYKHVLSRLQHEIFRVRPLVFLTIASVLYADNRQKGDANKRTALPTFYWKYEMLRSLPRSQPLINLPLYLSDDLV